MDSGFGQLILGESDNSPKFPGRSHDTQSRTGLIDWALDYRPLINSWPE